MNGSTRPGRRDGPAGGELQHEARPPAALHLKPTSLPQPLRELEGPSPHHRPRHRSCSEFNFTRINDWPARVDGHLIVIVLQPPVVEVDSSDPSGGHSACFFIFHAANPRAGAFQLNPSTRPATMMTTNDTEPPAEKKLKNSTARAQHNPEAWRRTRPCPVACVVARQKWTLLFHPSRPLNGEKFLSLSLSCPIL